MDATKTVTNEAQGTPLSTESKVLETGAAAGQVFPMLPTPILLETKRWLTHLLPTELRPCQVHMRPPERLPCICFRSIPLCRSEPLLLTSQ